MLAPLKVHLGVGVEPQPPAPWDLDGVNTAFLYL